MLKYEDVLNNKYIIEIYNNISNVSDNSLHAKHGWDHVLNVVKYIEIILTDLNYSKNIVNYAKIAGILHDVGCENGKNNHAKIGYEIAKRYLENKDLEPEYKEKILKAILNHSEIENINDIISAVLIFSDKIDFCKDRLTKVGMGIEYLNEFQYVDKVELSIINDRIIVNYITNDKKFDKDNLKKFYFTPKIFNAVENFGKFVNKDAYIAIDGQKWEQ